MPIYEYRCDDCGREFETFVTSGRPAAECPGCHGLHLKREMSVFAAARGGDATVRAVASAANGSSGPAGGCCGGGCGCA